MDVKLSDNPLVSIIIPVYNTAPYLKRCLDSVAGQTYENLEIILIDDGSTDGSIHILTEYQNLDGRIRVIRQENQGQASARNAGLDIASGEWVVFVDSDDEVSRDMVEILLGAVLREKAELGTGAYWLYDEKSGERSLKYARPGVYKGKEVFGTIFCSSKFMIACACIFRRSLFEKHRFPDGMIYEDTCLLAHILCDAESSVCVDIPVYFYYQREEGSAKGSGLRKQVYDQFYVWQRIKGYIDEAAPEYADDVRQMVQEASMNAFYAENSRQRLHRLAALKEIKPRISEKLPKYADSFQSYLFEICRGVLYLADIENDVGQLWALKELEDYAIKEIPEYMEDFQSYLFWVCCRFLCRIDRLGRRKYPDAWRQTVDLLSDIKNKKMKKSCSQRMAIVLFRISPVLYVKVQKIYSLLRGTEQLWM